MDENQDNNLNFFYKKMPNLSVGENGILRHIGTENSETGQIVISRSLTSRVLQKMHDDLGHFGTAKTSAMVRKRFFWPTTSLEVNDWWRNCLPCQKRKNPVPAKRAPLQPIVIHRQGKLVTMDIVEYPLSFQGYRYCLAMIDHFTKWRATKLKIILNQAYKTARDRLKMTHYCYRSLLLRSLGNSQRLQSHRPCYVVGQNTRKGRCMKLNRPWNDLRKLLNVYVKLFIGSSTVRGTAASYRRVKRRVVHFNQFSFPWNQ